jgi:hypothetical protein
MTTGRLDFGDLLETVGAERLNEIVVGSTYLAAVIATLPANHRAMITYMLVDALDGKETRLPVLSSFIIELVANSINNKEFPEWARGEIANSVN